MYIEKYWVYLAEVVRMKCLLRIIFCLYKSEILGCKRHNLAKVDGDVVFTDPSHSQF